MSTSVSGSSAVNGLRSNPNVISGLVSGLDTESMIEGLVDSYSQKITGYQQQIVLQEWKQDAYRGVIDNIQAFMNKFTNFSNSSTSTNLLSNSLFSNCTTTTAGGSNSDAVKVTGSTDSTVTVDSVLQVATSTTVVSSAIASQNNSQTIEGAAVDLNETYEQGTLSGSMTLQYGSSSVSISFNANDIITSDEELVKAINEKLQDKTLSNDPANTKIEAYLDNDGNVAFKDLSGAGNSVYISSAGSDLAETLGITTSSKYSDAATTMKINGVDWDSLVDDTETIGSNMVGRTLSFEFNGSTSKITIEEFTSADDLVTQIQEKLDEAFGGSIIVTNELDGTNGDLQMTFALSDDLTGSNSFSVSNVKLESLGFSGTSVSNTFTGSTTLSTINGDSEEDGGFGDLGRTIPLTSGQTVVSSMASLGLADNESLFAATGGGTWSEAAGCYFDNDGDVVVAVGNSFYKTDNDGNLRVGESIEINGKSVGTFDANSTIDDVLNAINTGNCGCNVSFSTLTNNFVFSSKSEGSNSSITIEGGLAEKLFGSTVPDEDGNYDGLKYNEGQDCIVIATVNGEQVELTRSSNTIDIEGLSITVSSTFNNKDTEGKSLTTVAEYQAAVDDEKLDATDVITFAETTDYQPIVDAVTSMIDEYNALMTEIKTLFTEVPLYTSSGSSYLPLTDADSESMSESAVAKYEADAKTGILFGDSNMRNLYNSLSSVFSASGAFGMDLYDMGIECEYGTWSDDHVTLNEEKLIAMLQSDPSRVQAAFTTSTNSGGSVDGVMQSLKNKMDEYASTTGATKGILIEAAGSESSPLSLLNNSMLTKIETFQNLIDTWESKLDSKITYYTAQFSKLEVLMSQANSQSSALGSLGGY